MHPKMIQFFSEEMELPIIKQYLESLAKKVIYKSSGSFYSFSVSLSTYFKNTIY